MAPTDDVNELDLDDLTEQDGPDESQDQDVTSDNDTPDVDNDVAPPAPDGGDPDDSDDDSGSDNASPNIPGQIPDDPQDDNQLVHQALIYSVRTVQELASHVANLDSNYAGLASELKAFLLSFVGRIETVYQNEGVNQSQADSLESNPTQQGRFQY